MCRSNERGIFLGQEVQGVSDIGKILDEAAIEVAKSQEGLYFFDSSRTGPFGDTGEFSGVHADLAFGNDYA